MRNIYFISNMHYDLHPTNSRSKFSTYINQNCLKYIPSGQIEAAIKNITFDNTRKKPMKSHEFLGIKSNISDPIISSGQWNNLLYTFNVEASNSLVNIDITNPTFFPTTREKLSTAKFEIVDLDTNCTPEFADGTPTFITITVKQQPDRMKQPFHILLDSSCQKSKAYFPSNSNADFTIKLPKRLEFKRDWIVALKSINITNSLYNVTDCFLIVENYKGKFHLRLNDGIYKTIDDLIKHMNDKMGQAFLFRKKQNGIIMTRKSKFKSVMFSKNLAKILKIPSDYNTNHFEKTYFLFIKYDLNALVPQQFIICCDMIEHSILGGQQVQVLKIVNKEDKEKRYSEYEFYNNDYVKLGFKEFEKIHIKIMTIGGHVLKCDSTLPTRLQLLFVNTDSR